MTGREGGMVAGLSWNHFIARRGCWLDWSGVGRPRAMSGMGESKGQCGGCGSLEKIIRVCASGNREPLLVLEQGICVYMPQVGSNRA